MFRCASGKCYGKRQSPWCCDFYSHKLLLSDNSSGKSLVRRRDTTMYLVASIPIKHRLQIDSIGNTSGMADHDDLWQIERSTISMQIRQKFLDHIVFNLSRKIADRCIML
ncbi:hypothetical protein OIU74_017776 [Salix koriyanagi]|uniref:Uncharacterized protein n=1 Tax=Salix koriyanagi TaxID=2511006 RepID=A0A9Q0WQV9_9ROSI|nr:hypothetical protein OIU74_017776 [Salix koriyanagi]